MTFGGDSAMVETLASEAILTHAKPTQPQCQTLNKSTGTQLQTIVYNDINAHIISHKILASLGDWGDGSDEVVYAAAKVVRAGPEAYHSDYSTLIGGKKRLEIIPIYEKVLGIHIPTIEYVGDKYSMLENLEMIEGLSSIYDIPSFPDEDKNSVTKIPPFPPYIQLSEMTPRNPQFSDGNTLSSKAELVRLLSIFDGASFFAENQNYFSKIPPIPPDILIQRNSISPHVLSHFLNSENTEDIMSISLDVDIPKWLSLISGGKLNSSLSHWVKLPSKTNVEKLSQEKFKVCVSLGPALAQLIVEMEKEKFKIPKHAQESAAKVKEISEVSGLYEDLKSDIKKEGNYDRRTKHDQELKATWEIVVANSKRLIYMLKMKALKMTRATYLVLNVVDWMFDIEFALQMRSTFGKTYYKKLLSSETMTHKVEELEREIISNPKISLVIFQM
ncbi:hypothetical protein LIER_13141 [Lithospermum erythrorhizon]|uniref:Uncharacterized protein n=1 Tax=Lithospermum erythrorhizon TaxID=34254 RepID=A0AAV3PYY1_LITER